MSRGQGNRCVRERYHGLFNVHVFGIACLDEGLDKFYGFYSGVLEGLPEDEKATTVQP